MLKRCVICDDTFQSDSPRRDNITCSVACRSKLSRQRRKADEERRAQLLTRNQKSMMIWLDKHIPDAAHNLRKLEAIHGRAAFNVAAEVIQSVGIHLKNQTK